jgi:hypothetical protein
VSGRQQAFFGQIKMHGLALSGGGQPSLKRRDKKYSKFCRVEVEVKITLLVLSDLKIVSISAGMYLHCQQNIRVCARN